ncbi:MAG: hypothetical protein ACXW03_01630 [Methylobacter sp.]
MSALLEKLKKSRQTNVTVDGKAFTITRPTPMQAMEWLNDMGGNPLAKEDVQQFYTEMFTLKNLLWRRLAQTAIERFVVGWPGMQEIDIIPGGSGVELPFDLELFLLWVQDHPKIITELGFHIFSAWLGHISEVDQELGKQEAG